MTEKEKYYAEIYKKAKKIMGNKTPLKKDCGLLCQKSCCSGSDETGMLLFPFEKTKLNIEEKGEIRLAVCNGSCDREDRPLACMLFPAFPYLSSEGKIKVVPDMRGVKICPLIKASEDIQLDRGFLWRVKKVGRLLSEDELCRSFIEEISKEIHLREILNGKNRK